jgi:ubiquitin carboxyl-terminal hydrolase 4/11/15
MVAVVHKSGTFQSVISSLAARYPYLVDEYHLDLEYGTVIAEIYMSKIHRFIDVSMPVSDFRSEDRIFIFQTSIGLACYAQIVHRKEIFKRRHRRTITRREIFGTPLVIAVSPKWTHHQLYTIIESHISPIKMGEHAFTIRLTSPDGSTCSNCGRTSCEGCPINPNSQSPIGFKGSWLYLAIDWHSEDQYNFSWETPVDLCPAATIKPTSTSGSQHMGHSVGSISLYDCLDAYTGAENLTGDNKWYCEKCAQTCEAERRIGFHILPDVLVVLLKRFQFSPSTGFEKVTASIDFPLFNFSLKSNYYDLYGIVNHYGTLSSGHYTATCAGPAGTSESVAWYLYNDHQVVPISEREIQTFSKSCYVLFYKRKGSRPANIINYGLND